MPVTDLVIDTAHAARTAEREHDRRYRSLRRRALAALVLAVPLLCGRYGIHASGLGGLGDGCSPRR